MVFMKKVIKSARRNLGRALLAGILLPSVVQAGEPAVEWIDFTESADFSWSARNNSASFIDVDGKKSAAYGYAYQKLDKKERTYAYGQVFVMLNECRNGYGHVVYNDTAGALSGKDQFVRNGSTVADDLGTMACMLWDKRSGKVSAQEKPDTWMVAAQTPQEDLKLSIKVDTIRKQNHDGKLAITALHSEYNATDRITNYGVYAFHVAACKKGMGKLYILDFDGKLTAKLDVALDGKSLGSGVASALCKKGA